MTDKNKGSKLSKAQKKEITNRHPSAPASKCFTDEQWSRLMWAGHSEVNEVMREISEENAKEGKGLLGMMQNKTGEKDE